MAAHVYVYLSEEGKKDNNKNNNSSPIRTNWDFPTKLALRQVEMSWRGCSFRWGRLARDGPLSYGNSLPPTTVCFRCFTSPTPACEEFPISMADSAKRKRQAAGVGNPSTTSKKKKVGQPFLLTGV